MLLAGCSAPAAPDPDAVQQWITDQEADAEGGSQATGLADTTEAAKEHPANGVRLDFPEPERVGSVTASCFGAETMQVAVEVSSETPEGASGSTSPSTQTAGTELTVTCADGAATIDGLALDQPVTSIRVNGHNERGFGAWSVTIP